MAMEYSLILIKPDGPAEPLCTIDRKLFVKP